MSENKRYDWDLNGIWDYNDESDEYIESYADITKLLNEQNDTICEQSIQIDFLQEENSHMRQLVQENRRLKELGQELYEWDSKRSLSILRVMQNFARKYSQDSIEYNLLYELGKELPINPNNLWSKEAFKEDEIND